MARDPRPSLRDLQLPENTFGHRREKRKQNTNQDVGDDAAARGTHVDEVQAGEHVCDICPQSGDITLRAQASGANKGALTRTRAPGPCSRALSATASGSQTPLPISVVFSWHL